TDGSQLRLRRRFRIQAPFDFWTRRTKKGEDLKKRIHQKIGRCNELRCSRSEIMLTHIYLFVAQIDINILQSSLTLRILNNRGSHSIKDRNRWFSLAPCSSNPLLVTHRSVDALRHVAVTGWMDNADIAAGSALS